MTVEAFPKRPVPPPQVVTPMGGAQARRTGRMVLVVGVLAAALLYGFRTWHAGPAPEDLLANYQEANTRQMGMLYGHTGVLMWEGLQALAQPGIEAILILVVTALIALVCFRVAWVDDDSPADGPGPRPS